MEILLCWALNMYLCAQKDIGLSEQAPLRQVEAAGSDEDITRCSFLETVISLIPAHTLYFIIRCKRFLYDLF